MKVKLLTDGRYHGMKGFDYSKLLTAKRVTNRAARMVVITTAELVAAGANPADFGQLFEDWAFFIGTECEVVEE
jgi:hypothetical protein